MRGADPGTGMTTTTVEWAAELYGDGLRAVDARPLGDLPDLRIRYPDGRLVSLDLARWAGGLTPADEALLARCVGPTLDVGCGPGRFAAALAARGQAALGIDIVPAAVELARAAGATALHRSVFGRLPGGGRWSTVLLADGNVGIGGDPLVLLSRIRALLAPAATVLCELDGPGTPAWAGRVRLESAAGRTSQWFSWAHVGVDDVYRLAADAGLCCREVWHEQNRWFAVLVGGKELGAVVVR